MFIYKITNNINGNSYIGLDGGIVSDLKRWKNHIESVKYRETNMPIHHAMKKHGIENFSIEVLETCKNTEHLIEREIFWIEKLNTYHNGYNATRGGQYQPLNSKETRKKKSLAAINYNKNRWASSSLEDRKEHGRKVRLGISKEEKIKRKNRAKAQWNDPEHHKTASLSMKKRANEPHRIMVANHNLQNINNNKKWKLTNPDGDVYLTEDLPKFCKKHVLVYGCMTAVARRLKKGLNTNGHRGWYCNNDTTL